MRPQLFCLGLCALPISVMAGVFDPVPADKSMTLLGTVFGTVGHIALGGAANPALNDMMRNLNQIVVTIAALMVTYIGVVSTINTAQEGTVMGRKFSSIWVPMRSLAGSLLLIPSPASGYSMIQVAVMWVIIQGIGAADQVWNTVLNRLASGINFTTNAANVNEYGVQQNGKDLAYNMLHATTCVQTLRAFASLTDETRISIANPTVGDPTNRSYSGTLKALPCDAPLGSNITPPPVCDTGNALRQWTYVPQPTTPSRVESGGLRYSNILFAFGDDNAGSNPYNAAVNSYCGHFEVSGTAFPRDWDGVDERPADHSNIVRDAASDIFNAKLLALGAMHHILSPLSELIVYDNVGPRTENSDILFKSRLSNGQPFPGGYRHAAIQAYKNILGGLAISRSSRSSYQRGGGWAEKIIDQGRKGGWVACGSFYFVLNRSTATRSYPDVTNRPKGKSIPREKGIRGDQEGAFSSQLRDYLGNVSGMIDALDLKLKDSATYMDNDNEGGAGGLSLGNAWQGSYGNQKMMKEMSEANANSINWMMETLSQGQGDPLLGHAILGQKLMLAAEIAWITITAIGLVLSIISIWACTNPGFMLALAIYMFIGMVCVGVCVLLFTIGSSLALYMPLVPYMMFTVGVLAWMLLVIEAVMAAPILALGLVMPSGDELGKIATGLTLLTGIFLRPTLMVFGFLLGTQVYKAIIELVNWSMAENYKAIPSGTMFSPIITMFIYAGFIISLTNKSFSLINAVPDRIMRWIGGSVENTNAQQELEAAKGAGKAATQQVGDAANMSAKGSAVAAQKGAQKAAAAKLAKGAGDNGGGKKGDSKDNKHGGEQEYLQNDANVGDQGLGKSHPVGDYGLGSHGPDYD